MSDILIDSRIELALGADLTADPSTWVWTDLSARAQGSITVKPGREDESGQTQPASCSARMANPDGWLTPRFPTSPYWPYMRRQTPFRAAMNPRGLGYFQRFQGYIDMIAPTWPDGTEDWSEVEITASGNLRRLGQGDNPLSSPMRRSIVGAGPVTYVPMEEPAGANQLASGLPGGTSMVTTGTVTFGQDNVGLPGAKATIKVGADGYWAVGVQHTFATHWQVDLFAHVPAPPASDTVVFRAWTAGGTVAFWDFIQGGTTQRVRGYDPYGAILVDSGLYSANAFQTSDWQHLRLMAQDLGGGSIQYQLVSFPIFGNGLAFGGTFSGTLGNPYYVQAPAQATLADTSYAHLAVYDAWNFSATDFSARGWAGETPSQRIGRLCGEVGVEVDVFGASTTTMGPQTPASFLDLLRECEKVDGGILYDGVTSGLSYMAGPARYNRAVALQLDCDHEHVSGQFQPVEDDQQVRNDWTISRSGGSSAQYTDPVHIAANNLYDDSTSLNVQFDAQLFEQASWRVHMGTVDEMRVPNISIRMAFLPDLWADWLTMILGDRLTAVNLPKQYPPGPLDMVIEGYVEKWDATSWTVDLNTSPFAPWRIATFAADTGDTSEFVARGDPDNTALNAGITATAVSFAVKTTTGPLWTTTATKADDFPFHINVGGEQIRVDSITGASSPQTFNVTRSRNSVVKSHLANAPVLLWAPPGLAL